jgi:hypothetical protein
MAQEVPPQSTDRASANRVRSRWSWATDHPTGSATWCGRGTSSPPHRYQPGGRNIAFFATLSIASLVSRLIVASHGALRRSWLDVPRGQRRFWFAWHAGGIGQAAMHIQHRLMINPRSPSYPRRDADTLNRDRQCGALSWSRSPPLQARHIRPATIWAEKPHPTAFPRRPPRGASAAL